MKPRNFIKFLPLVAAALLVAMTTACSSEKEKDKQFDQVLVINELIASNHTGMLNQAGETADWIEIKNVSDEEVSLADYTFEYKRAPKPITADKKKDKKKKKKKDNDKAAQPDKADKGEKNDSIVIWNFPEMTIKPGQCLLIWADKGETKGEELHVNFKLSSDGGRLQLITRKTHIMSEVKYGPMLPDETYRRNANNKMEKSLEATPGHDNDKKGFEAYNELLDKQRQGAEVKIWRVMSKAGKESDSWAEVKNVSDHDVDLAQYALTDNPKKPAKWQFPAVTLAPGKTYHVQFMGKKAPEGDPKKANFKIDEEVVILTCKGKFVDGVNATGTRPGTIIGRDEQGKGFFYFRVSRDKAQDARGYRYIAERPTFETRPGVYGDKKSLSIRVNGHGRKVHYTTGLAIPSGTSPVMDDSVTINASTTFRVYAEGDSTSLPSEVVTASYLLGQHHDMAVLNITMNEADLFNFNTGIYVAGPNPGSEVPHKGANYWKDWEKRAHVEFFDGKQGFSEGVAVKIFGGFSRMLAKKSLHIKFNGKYGPSSLVYDLFGHGKTEKFKGFVLRSGGQDAGGLMGRDEFFTSLMARGNPHMIVQDYRPVAVYLNNNYFGMFFIREKINNNFISRHMGIKANDVTQFQSKYLEQGRASDYYGMLRYLESHKGQELFDYARENFDLENLIDFKIGEIYSMNTDIGNNRYFRSTDEGSDLKWHWIFYDVDCGFRETRSAAHYLGLSGDSYSNAQNRPIALLLKSPEIRDLFLQRLSHHLHHTLTVKNTTQVFDALMASIDKEMQLNCKRWPNLMSYDRWKKYQQPFREQLLTRNKEMLNDIRSYLKVTPEEDKKYFSDLGY